MFWGALLDGAPLGVVALVALWEAPEEFGDDDTAPPQAASNPPATIPLDPHSLSHVCASMTLSVTRATPQMVVRFPTSRRLGHSHHSPGAAATCTFVAAAHFALSRSKSHPGWRQLSVAETPIGAEAMTR